MSTKKQSTSVLKRLFIVGAGLFSIYLVFVGIFFIVNTVNIRPYKALANDLNQTLGGGYTTNYTWKCGIDTPNCPSARMIKDANFASNEEAKALMSDYINKLKSNNYLETGISICEPRAGFEVYCTVTASKDGKTIIVNAKQDFIGIDIQS